MKKVVKRKRRKRKVVKKAVKKSFTKVAKVSDIEINPTPVVEKPQLSSEQFVPKRNVESFIAMGYKEVEVGNNAGFSVPVEVRDSYINSVKRGENVYMVK